MKADGTYEYGPELPKFDNAGVACSEQVSSFAYFPTFKGLVTYRDTKGTTRTIITEYEFKGGDHERNWLPKLDSSTVQDGAVESSAEIFVLNNNFRQPEKRRKVLGVLEHLAPTLGYFSVHVGATDPDVRKNFNKLLVDDMFDTDQGTILFLRLGEKVLCPSVMGEGYVPMIDRTKLYRLNVASGEILKYAGNNIDYTLGNQNNWEHYTTI